MHLKHLYLSNFKNYTEAELDFWKRCPTVWDESLAIDGEPGEYIVQARRSGAAWYVGVLNGLDGRELTLDTSLFTEKGKKYKVAADKIIDSLNRSYQSEYGANYGFLLLHSTGSAPHKSEVDVPLSYADYYYLEALWRKRSLDN